MKPRMFDVIRLLVNLPEHDLQQDAEGTIVECYPDDTYEIEFDDESGGTLALCSLSSDQFRVVWQAKPQKSSLA